MWLSSAQLPPHRAEPYQLDAHLDEIQVGWGILDFC